jgi:hypothetical protein
MRAAIWEMHTAWSARAREGLGRGDEGREALVADGLAGGVDDDARDVDARAHGGAADARSLDHERRADGGLGVAAVRVGEAEQRRELGAPRLEDRGAVALEHGARAGGDGRGLGLVDALELPIALHAEAQHERGHLAALPEIGGAERGGAGLAAGGRRAGERGRGARGARVRARHLHGGALVRGDVLLLEDRGGELGAGARLAERGHEVGEVVRAEALAGRVEVAEQLVVQAARVGEAVLRIAREHLAHDRGDGRGDVGPQELEGRIFARLHAAQGLERGRGGERVRPREDLVEDDAEREDVAAPVDGARAALLGAHVRELAAHLAHLLVAGLVDDRVDGLRDAEVGDLDLALPGDEHVLRRDVAVDDAERPRLLVAAAVRVIEGLRHLGREEDRHADGDLALLAPAPREHRSRGRAPARTPSR